MKTVMSWMLVSAMLIVATPAFSVEAVQTFRCEQEDDATEAGLRALAKEWLTAARKMKGGENMTLSLYFPIVTNSPGETDFLFVVRTPSVAEWGQFWDGYDGSPASEVDKGLGSKAVCTDSALWEIQTIKP